MNAPITNETPTTCAACGKPTWTKAQGKFFVEKCSVPVKYFELCDACKRAHYAKKFADFAEQGGGR